MKKPRYKRVLLKLSGEALASSTGSGLDHKACQSIAASIKEIYDLGVEIGIVIGGGNIFRGNLADKFGFQKTPADHVGMLSTTVNGLILSQVLYSIGCRTKVLSALPISGIVEPYNWSQSLIYLEKKIILLFVGGTGNPYFTTDTAASLRASEINADVLIKLTKVDGVYDKDPITHSDAKKFERLSYNEVLNKKLNVMDATAVALCRESKLPIHVINLFSKDAIMQAIMEGKGGTFVEGE